MPNVDFKRDLLPHFAAIAIFFIVTIIFFAPVIFEDKTLPQHDITQWQGSAQELKEYREQTGKEGFGPIRCLVACQVTWSILNMTVNCT